MKRLLKVSLRLIISQGTLHLHVKCTLCACTVSSCFFNWLCSFSTVKHAITRSKSRKLFLVLDRHAVPELDIYGEKGLISRQSFLSFYRSLMKSNLCVYDETGHWTSLDILMDVIDKESSDHGFCFPWNFLTPNKTMSLCVDSWCVDDVSFKQLFLFAYCWRLLLSLVHARKCS